jgi:lipopolysaccharide transport system ATP-binding protein
MSDIVIKVENLSKQYRLGVVGTGTLTHDLNRWWHTIRGKEDPYLKIGETNDRSTKGNSDYVWALKDINFEVNQGEVLGIIGKNGAGKSTLLKLLSRVTTPTTGAIKTRGRIASLLEVGTGFHPELTGRDNVFLNGAILGMTKAEIKQKFDEIVEFSGTGRYIDTPVKRYSSGMRVRLAFAVAAYLEPEILIVDEVLAVGDAEFQKKAIGKMQDVSRGEGKTVLFVSHNMTAVQSLCTRALWLMNGELKEEGATSRIVSNYLRRYNSTNLLQSWSRGDAPGNDEVKLIHAEVIIPEKGYYQVGDSVQFKFSFYKNEGSQYLVDITFHLVDEMNNLVFVGSTTFVDKGITLGSGLISAQCFVPTNIMQEGNYTISRLLFVKNRGTVMYEHIDALTFEVINTGNGLGWMGSKEGIIKPKLDWEVNLSK